MRETRGWKHHRETVRTNIVQSIRLFGLLTLQDAAQTLGHHFLYANLAHAQTKQDVLDLIGQQFKLPSTVSKNFDALYDAMTDPVHTSPVPNPVSLPFWEHIPANVKFDKGSARAAADIFRDTADYWGTERFRSGVSISFSVARSANQPSRTGERG